MPRMKFRRKHPFAAADPYEAEEAYYWRGHPFRWLIALLRPVRRAYLFAFALTIVTTVLAIVPSIATGRIVDDVLVAGRYERFFIYALMLGGVPLLRSLMRYCYRLLYEDASQYALIRLRDAVYTRLQMLNPSYYHEVSTGTLMSRLTGDLDMVRFFLAWVGWSSAEQLVLFLVGAVYLMTISLKLTLACLAVAPLIAVTAAIFSKKIGPLWSQVREKREDLTSVVQENIAANRIVRAFVRQDFETERFEVKNAAFRDARDETSMVVARYIPLMNAFAGALSIPMLLIGGLLVIRGEMSPGDLVVYSGLLFVLEGPMFTLGFQINDLQRVATSAEKLLETLTAKPMVEDPEPAGDYLSKKEGAEASRRASRRKAEEVRAAERYHWRSSSRTAEKSIDELVTAQAESRTGLSPKNRIEGAIRFENVSFAYGRRSEDRTCVLCDLNLDIPAGSTVGFIGPTGSGKTTLTRLISRLYDPDEGTILMDGQDLREYKLRDLRRQIAVVTQDVFLFSDTVDGNIAFSQPDMAQELSVGAAVNACADEFIRKMSNGYETIVGERGVGLSGGQKQRISLARAIASQAPVLILDDTTSAVDLETDRRIRENLSRLKTPKRNLPQTRIIIAQRIASLRDCDRIFVLDQGHLMEEGTHEELVDYGGIYCEIYRMQLGRSQLVARQIAHARGEAERPTAHKNDASYPAVAVEQEDTAERDRTGEQSEAGERIRAVAPAESTERAAAGLSKSEEIKHG